VRGAQIADGEISALKLAAESVTGLKVQLGAITSDKIADNTILEADIAGRCACALYVLLLLW
jgi:hypothetical protein